MSASQTLAALITATVGWGSISVFAWTAGLLSVMAFDSGYHLGPVLLVTSILSFPLVAFFSLVGGWMLYSRGEYHKAAVFISLPLANVAVFLLSFVAGAGGA